jgi:predicted alpha-1,6-mannanase (GH76 family)
MLLMALVPRGLAADGAATPVMATAPSSAAPSATPVPTAAPSAATTLAAAEALEAVDSFDRAFYSVSRGRGLFLETAAGPKARFWTQAEMMEAVEDAYVRSGKTTYKRMIGQLHDGIVSRYGTDWLNDKYNDDIMWMVIAFMRAYALTGHAAYRSEARRNFDRAYARAHSTDFGGGLWWTTSRHEKNACVTAPATIAACLLSRSLGDASYLAKAKALFGWLQSTLYDPQSGAVHDHISRAPSGASTVVDGSPHSYNQGTFIGAANLLLRTTGRSHYRNVALTALAYTQKNLTDSDGILDSEGSGGDGGGFRGIFARWAVRFTRDSGTTSFNDWLDSNADAAWSHRNAQGLVGSDWTATSVTATLYSFDCSSAVVMMQVRP